MVRLNTAGFGLAVNSLFPRVDAARLEKKGNFDRHLLPIVAEIAGRIAAQAPKLETRNQESADAVEIGLRSACKGKLYSAVAASGSRL
jgi:hypothetical protein